MHSIVTGQYAYHRSFSEQGLRLGDTPPCSGSVAHHTDRDTHPRVHSRSVYPRAHRHTEQKRVCGTSVYRHNVACSRRAPLTSEMDQDLGSD